MKLKLNPDVCYLAGITSSSKEKKNAVGIFTSISAIEERFVKIAIGLGIEPNKIIVEETKRGRHIYFFHSIVARMLKKINEKSSRLFKKKNELAASYVAGLFDGNAHAGKSSVSIKNLSTSDRLVLEQMGIHMINERVMNVSALLELVREKSVIAEQLSMFAKRDSASELNA